MFLQCLPMCVVSPSAVLVHRSVFGDVGSFDESYPVCEDYELWLRVAARHRVALVREPLVTKFGGHADQLSRCFWGMDRWRVRALYSCLCRPALPWLWRRAAHQEMGRKLRILITGYAKRGKEAEASKLEQFEQSIAAWWQRKGAGPESTIDATVLPLPELLRAANLSSPRNRDRQGAARKFNGLGRHG